MSEEASQVIATLRSAENSARLAIDIAFGVSLILNGLLLQTRVQPSRAFEIISRVARVCYILGTAFLVVYCTLQAVSPSTSLPLMVNVGVALVIAVITLGIDRDNPGVPALHFLSGALIFLLTTVPSFLFRNDVVESSNFGWLSIVHISTAIGGEGLFVVAFCGSLLYVWDYRRLKQKRLERRPFLPSLDTLDKIVEKTSLVGLLLITTSLITGLALVFGGAGQSASLTKIIWAFTVWTWYVLAIFGREFLGWRGRRGAHLSIWGTVILLLALFGTLTRTP